MLLIIIGLLAASVSSSAQVIATPGKAAVWTNDNKIQRSYNSQTTDVDKVVEQLKPYLQHEVVVILTSSRDSLFNLESTRNAMQTATDLTVFPYVYRTVNKNVEETAILSSLQKLLPLKMETISLNSLITKSNTCDKKTTCILNDNKADVYLIELKGTKQETQELLHLFTMKSSNTPITFVALVEPHANAYSNQLLESAHFKLMDTSNITSGNGTVVDDSLLYSPEGAEYSIYYANTFLYITPDIFTGLMTGLFLAFTALIGLNCLGSIQGPATFASKSPPVGKEG